MDKAQVIQITNAVLGYRKNSGNLEILKNINLTAYSRDFIGVVGFNGSGKSTLLKSTCALLPILNGEILLNGTSVSSIGSAELAKMVSIVLTEKISGFNLTCFDAVAAGQLPYTNLFNTLEKEHLEIISAAIDVCGIKEHLQKPLSELSDGLFQKTMIAKSIAQQTNIMLLDEPSAFLDYSSKHELFILLKKLTEEQNKCVIVSSHDLDLILKYCNKIILVKDTNVEIIETSKAQENKLFNELSGGYLKY